jgi:hypothetical protein
MKGFNMSEKEIFWTVKKEGGKYLTFFGRWTTKLSRCCYTTSEAAHLFVKENKEKYNGLKVVKAEMAKTFKEVN